MIRTFDGKSFKRVGGLPGDRGPQTGFQRIRALYTAVGGETAINLNSLTPSISYFVGQNQISVKRSSGGSLIAGVDFFEYSPTEIRFPISDPLLAGEVVEVVREFAVTGIAATQARPDVFTQTAQIGQTLVTCPFSWPYNLNQTYGQGAVRVYLHGVLQTRGIDYNEVNLGQANTNQFEFIDALEGGENIAVLPVYQVLDQSAAASTFLGNQNAQFQAILSTLSSFVDETQKIVVPSTQIQGRARIPDIANDLRASFGIDRIPIQQLFELEDERGPQGQSVWKVVGDDRGLIRLVGNWYTQVTSDGAFANPNNNTDNFIEVTFYGTGLNVLSLIYGNGYDFRASVDGGAETGNLTYGSYSTINAQPNYATNMVVQVASGLPLGIHTVRVRNNNGASLSLYGIEVIGPSNGINVNPGAAYTGGQKYVTISQSSQAFKTGFENILDASVGTRGGRALIYQKPSGVVAKAFQPVDSVAKFLTLSDHSNESIIRNYNWREFGAGRGDDFSTLAMSTSNRTFTLDDGTTCLTGFQVLQNNGSGNANTLRLGASLGDFLVFTFVGTGLDIVREDNGGGTSAQNYEVSVDGTVVGNLSQPHQTLKRLERICSGLPYGTHVMRIRQTAAATTANMCISQFRVYGPKKANLPQGSIELADYYVMGDYALPSAGAFITAPGVLRKMSTREIAYVGTSWGNAGFESTFGSGRQYEINSGSAGNFVEYVFFGTGVEVRTYGGFTFNATLSIDGSSNLSGYTTSTFGTGIGLTASTGAFTGNATGGYGSGASIRGLTLGVHRVRVTYNSGRYVHDCFDVITPVHSPRDFGLAIQNTAAVGSCGISDLRKVSAIRDLVLYPRKTLVARGTNTVTTTSTVPTPLADMALVLKKDEPGFIDINFSTSNHNGSAATNNMYSIYVNGIQVSDTFNMNQPSTTSQNLSIPFALHLHKGTHFVQVHWYVSGGTGFNTARTMTVKEL